VVVVVVADPPSPPLPAATAAAAAAAATTTGLCGHFAVTHALYGEDVGVVRRLHSAAA
jgi:hypothetical protein